jgi:hypothetical protein
MKILLSISSIIIFMGTCFSQVSTPFNFGTFGDYSGWNAGQLFPFEIRHNGAFPIEFYTNNVERMTIRGQAGFNEGFVGINQPVPTQRLTCNGDLDLQTNIFVRTATNDGYRINDSTVLQVKNNDNLFVGWGAGASWVTAAFAQNTFVGNSSGFSNTTGGHNTFMGFESGESNVDGDENTFIGFRAGEANIGTGGGAIDGDRNTFIGSRAGLTNTFGRENTFVGFQTGQGNTIGIQNTMIGSYNAGAAGSTGNRNTLVGHDCGQFFTTGDENAMLGAHAGQFITTGNFNTLLGTFAANNITTGGNNTIGGHSAARQITTGGSNTIFGYEAGQLLTTGPGNTLLGFQASENITTGLFNISIGFNSALNLTTGEHNIVLGTDAGTLLGNANNNIIMGRNSGQNTTANRNVFIGRDAGELNVGGFNNVYAGNQAGEAQLGTLNTYIGNQAGDAPFTLTNSAAFGNGAQPTADNDMILGNNLVQVGIGLSDDAAGPANKLEINESAALFSDPNGAGGTGFSGLRFRDLTSGSVPNTLNPGPGVLALDPNGDVIYVPEQLGNPGILGALCTDPAPAGNLTANSKVNLNDFALYFEDGPTPTAPDINQVSIGYDCVELPPAKFSVDNVGQEIGIHSETIGVTAPSTIGLRAYATDNINAPFGSNIAVEAFATGGDVLNVGVVSQAENTSGLAFGCFGGRFSGSDATFLNFGLTAGAVSITGSPAFLNVGVNGTANEGDRNTGVNGFASGGTIWNHGVEGCAFGPVGSETYAGFFCGDISVGGNIYISDENLKENIEEISADSAEFIINNLTPVTYNYNSASVPGLNLSSGHRYGLIAQDVEAILPSTIHDATVPGEIDSLGNIISPDQTFKGFEYNNLIAILTANAKSKNELIDSLEQLNSLQDSLLNDLLFRVSELENCKCVPKPKGQEFHGEGGHTSEEQQIDVELSNVQNIVLNQNVPNPFAEKTKITYSIPDVVQRAQMLFYDSNGRLIDAIDIQTRGIGQMNVFGEDLSSGIYSYALVTDGGVVLTKRMVKAK